MTRAIRIHAYGGADALCWEPVEVADPGPGQVRLRHTAIGLNFIDVYERTGLYQGELPRILGHEAAGVVEALGPKVRHLQVGDRVAYAVTGTGAYSEQRLMDAGRLVKIPDGLDDHRAAALMLKGMTVQALLRQTYRVRKGDAVLIHAAAGGVGSIAVQWAKAVGATVFAVVGSESKVELVRSLGADHALLDGQDWVGRVRELTGGQGVHVVYDSVGQQTFMRSLDCLRVRGMMVSYGNSSGPVQPIAPLELGRRGSLYLTRPAVFTYIATKAALTRSAQEVFDLVARGVISVKIGQTYPLREAAQAHRDLEARRTTGATVLIP